MTLMTTYRIRTEDRQNLGNLTSQFFDAFSMYHGLGYWHGSSEPSALIEITTNDDQKVKDLARAIKYANGQETVLVESLESKGELI